ncbi:MAG: hypothetical protein C0507_17440 [Cyanobacteria bacterium PR.3.49]|nr:hypothetical protein [Cyanobacteria bacterium PR.3.49]
MAHGHEDIRLGTLLTQAGIVTDADVTKSKAVSDRCRIPLGKALVIQEKMSDSLVLAAVHAQWMLRDGFISKDDALEALRTCRRNRWNLPDALILMEIDAHASKGFRLGELLTRTNIIGEEELRGLLNAAQASGLPLGRVLTTLDLISEQLLNEFLATQERIRKGEISLEKGLEHLQGTADKIAAKENQGMLLGELLTKSGLITETELEEALTEARQRKRLLGVVLAEKGPVKPEHLSLSLRMQRDVRHGTIKPEAAIELLKSIAMSPSKTEELLEAAGLVPTVLEKNMSLYQFFKVSGFFRNVQLKELCTKLAQEPQFLRQILQDYDDFKHLSGSNFKEAIEFAVESSKPLELALMRYYPDQSDLVQFAVTLRHSIRTGALDLSQAIIQFAIRSSQG